MTEQEQVIVSAYTGYAMCGFDKIHEYIEKKMGRPVWTHEFAFSDIWDEIREAVKDDFINLCADDIRTKLTDDIRTKPAERKEE